ncbi:MAG TPA: glucose 1-dehydrogenase [Thermoanaerobaculia bacterium]
MPQGFFLDLTPKTALVTGGTRGIGKAVSRLLAQCGARVAFTYRANEAAANGLVREIRDAGGEAMALAADAGDPGQSRQAVRDVVAAWQRLDILIVNAGIWEEGRAGTGALDVWDRTFAINARGAFLVTEAAIPHLEREKGTIVYVSSTAGQRGESEHAAYAASKGALISYTKSLAAELAPRGIRVNCVAPGWVDTDMSASALTGESRRAIEASIPARRVASAEDIAGPILFLVSDLARHVHGEILNVNGGSVLVG